MRAGEAHCSLLSPLCVSYTAPNLPSLGSLSGPYHATLCSCREGGSSKGWICPYRWVLHGPSWISHPVSLGLIFLIWECRC